MPREHGQFGTSTSDRPAAVAYLVVRDGDKWKDVFRLTPGQVTTIGRAPTNRIVVRDEMCSRNHCEIFQAGPMWILRDLGSRNGTMVDSHRMTGDWELEDSQTIQLGECEIVFTYELANSARAADDDEEEIEPPTETRESMVAASPRGS
ncbi:MAG TPA: FHA domain-containing protein, partial [Planctomycetaceae bacterium]|nr:FHA domain-containing protein [Planctomycetaceae bacterium]